MAAATVQLPVLNPVVTGQQQGCSTQVISVWVGLAYSYTYRATEREPTEHRIERKRKWGLNGPKTPLPQCKVN